MTCLCLPCAAGQSCANGFDCDTGICSLVTNKCLAPTCSDSTKNGNETDSDCGGPDCGPCRDGLTCADSRDCLSRVCDAGECLAPSCDDGVFNGDEIDVDCGGSCDPCSEGNVCEDDSQCSNWNT